MTAFTNAFEIERPLSSPATDGNRHIAASELTDLVAPKRSVKSACVGQLFGANFAIIGISNWPTEGIH